MENISYFFVFWHMQLYMSWYIKSFFGFTFLNILYFFKYSCTSIFHRRSLYTFYILSSLCKTTHRHWIHINVCRVSCGGVFIMLLVISIIFYFHYNICGCMCSTGPFQYRWLKGYSYRYSVFEDDYYHNKIGSIHLSHCYHIFPWLCAWDVCYIIVCHLLHIRSWKTGNFFSWLLCSLWWVQIVGRVLACRSYSFVCIVHHLIIIIVQSYIKTTLNLQNACQIYFVECVSKTMRILSITHYTICGAVSFQFTYFCCDSWENIYTLSNYHHQIGSRNYYPLLRVRPWNNGVHYKLSILFILHKTPAYLDTAANFNWCFHKITIYISWWIFWTIINVTFNLWNRILLMESGKRAIKSVNMPYYL